jgi:very-short-patch-repair endonuclease
VAIAKLAAAQHGVVSRRQLLRIGASRTAIDHRIAVRRLLPIHLGVYAVGHAALRITGVYGAAVLAGGDGAVASHRSAAHLLGLLAGGGGLIDVTVPRRGSRRRPGLRIHTARELHRDDVTVHEGVPCTSVARTLLDLAGLDPPRLLDRAVEQAQILRLFDGRAIEAALQRAAGRRGPRRLRRLLVELADEPPPVRNELERRFLELVRGGQLPEPAVNEAVAGHLVDFHWPQRRLVAETDGRATHAIPAAFETDHRRDLDLELAGWHVVRFTWRQVVYEPERVATVLRARLACR